MGDDRMLQTISADKMTCSEVEQRFGLTESDEPVFFEKEQRYFPMLTIADNSADSAASGPS